MAGYPQSLVRLGLGGCLVLAQLLVDRREWPGLAGERSPHQHWRGQPPTRRPPFLCALSNRRFPSAAPELQTAARSARCLRSARDRSGDRRTRGVMLVSATAFPGINKRKVSMHATQTPTPISAPPRTSSEKYPFESSSTIFRNLRLFTCELDCVDLSAGAAERGDLWCQSCGTGTCVSVAPKDRIYSSSGSSIVVTLAAVSETKRGRRQFT
jgi:hypothetical protein